MKKYFLLFLLVSFPFQLTWAKKMKVIVFTDQEGGTQANESLALFNTYPLNLYQIEYQVVVTPSDKLGCRVTNNPVEGMVDCDDNYISKRLQALNGDQAMVVPKVGTRGSSGKIPYIPVERPLGSMLHEFMHTLGCDDEYTYVADIANIYCKKTTSTVNNVSIEPRNPYASDNYAKVFHGTTFGTGRIIPWFLQIESTTLITTGTSLGTARPGGDSGEPTGLYQSDTCKNATPLPIKMWKPGFHDNVMGDTSKQIGGPLGSIVAKILNDKGISLKLVTPPPSQSAPSIKTFDGGRFHGMGDEVGPYAIPEPVSGSEPR